MIIHNLCKQQFTFPIGMNCECICESVNTSRNIQEKRTTHFDFYLFGCVSPIQ